MAALVVLIGYGAPVVSIVPSERFEIRRYDLPPARTSHTGARRLMPGIGPAPWKISEPLPNLRRNREARAARKEGGGPRVMVLGGIGSWGFWGGPDLHIVDVMALADPLLSRLPPVYDPAWWPGHRMRAVPRGYVESVLAAKSGIPELGVKALDNLVRTVTRRPLWERARWSAIIRLHMGAWQSQIVEDDWRFAEILRVDATELSSTPLMDDELGNALVFGWAGVEIRLGKATQAALLEMSLDGAHPYRLLFMREKEVLAWTDVTRPDGAASDLFTAQAAVPMVAVKGGYDAIRIKAHVGKRFSSVYRLGHLGPLAPGSDHGN